MVHISGFLKWIRSPKIREENPLYCDYDGCRMPIHEGIMEYNATTNEIYHLGGCGQSALDQKLTGEKISYENFRTQRISSLSRQEAFALLRNGNLKQSGRAVR